MLIPKLSLLAFGEPFVKLMFTKREVEVLRLIAQGYSTEAIAARLYRTTETIKSHRKNIRQKAQENGEDITSLPVFAVKYVKLLDGLV
ncbi:response regulator transcription factor [Dyadobacter sp. CY347]|uniref:response regulator transcription factor n=1 Tax=Dyadobacter sp. CY347 TaxID=2909336 RepID=UPI001F42D18D|nr:helix-turn-helix transcriptional regulator [Dyadobacter sp. CY347]MCF2491374.1 helix-turn-helix transcriptional regulator [Dyadobacter sp. CY347]